jgi:hypothetical protein
VTNHQLRVAAICSYVELMATETTPAATDRAVASEHGRAAAVYAASVCRTPSVVQALAFRKSP